MDKLTYIKRAEQIHNGKYVYDNLPLSFKCTDNIPIICKEHGVFNQIARNHTNQKQGCPICGRIRANQKMTETFEGFVEKAQKVHGDKYEYIKESFVKTNEKLQIKCKKCGNIFEQKGISHLCGCGCTYCNPPHTRLTTEQFKEKISKTHPNLEVLSEYISSNKPITVRCKIHDYTYITTPHRLRQGANCQKCYDDRRGSTLRKSIETVKKELKEIHGDKYEFPYIEKEYVNNKSKITAICKIHGEFKTTLNRLLKGCGCKRCADILNGKKKRLPLDVILKRFNKKHHFKYEYPYIEKEYETTQSLITINCPIHGEYKQKVYIHLDGCGCPTCNESYLERDVNSLLIENNFQTERQKHFDWLRNTDTNFKLSIDFFIRNEKICIECQGGQHFYEMEIFGSEEGFTKIKQRDITKYNLCKENGIGMIYITNKKFKRYLKQKQFNGIYDKNVLFIEDIEKDNNILFKLINEMKE